MFTWTELIKEYEMEMLILGKSKRHIQSSASYVRNFDKYLIANGYAEVQVIPKPILKGYMASIVIPKRYTPKTVNRFVANVRSVLRYAKEEGYISEDNATVIKYVKETDVVVNTFNNSEALQLLNFYKIRGNDYYNTRNWAMMYVLFETGVRNQELCNLKVENLKDNYIEIIDGKGQKSRAVPYTPELKKVIMKYLRARTNYMQKNNQEPIDYLFQSYRGSQLTGEAVERVTREAGKAIKLRPDIRCNPHNMRHFFACGLLKNGLDVFSVSKLMGHANINVTQIYLNSVQQHEIISMSMNASITKNLLKNPKG